MAASAAGENTSKGDSRAFRNALGRFPTGVTVITANDAPRGRLVGITISSFNSVSLDPPLVLWSLVKTSPSMDVFQNGQKHIIHVLSEGQKEIALRFSTSGVDKFKSVALEEATSASAPPALQGCTARFYCTVVSCVDGGDHNIIIARVDGFDSAEKEPLVFYRGGFPLLDFRHIRE